MTAIRITVEYFAHSRTAAGTPSEILSLDAPVTLAGVLSELARRHGPRLEALIAGGPARSAIIAVDGRQVAPAEDIELRGGETVVIIPAISGGGHE